MKGIKSLFFALSLSSTLFTFGQDLPFKIEVWQYDSLIEPAGNEVRLKKDEFKIKVSLYNLDGVHMFCSYDRDYYEMKSSEPFPDLKYIAFSTMVESDFNVDQELVITNSSNAYLFYDTTYDWHRFDKDLIINGDTVIGTKTVSRLWEKENDKYVSLPEVKKDVYLFFIATPKYVRDQEPVELGRYKLRIHWVE